MSDTKNKGILLHLRRKKVTFGEYLLQVIGILYSHLRYMQSIHVKHVQQ